MHGAGRTDSVTRQDDGTGEFMHLSDEEQSFLAKRSRLLRKWRFVGLVLLAVSACLGIWLLLSRPLLVNPFVVMARLESGAISRSTLALMAGMLPVTTLMCLVLTIAVIALAYSAFSNEKRYISIIQRECCSPATGQNDDPTDAPGQAGEL